MGNETHEGNLSTISDCVPELLVRLRYQFHTNTVENAFSLLKRGIVGNFHQVSIKHLHRYLNEFEYRFNRREEQEQLFPETVMNLLTGKQIPFAELVAKPK